MTNSFSARKKKLRREKGPSSKVMRKKADKLLQERLERLRARPQNPVPAGKTGRNDTCPCKSGQKYKRCCLLGPEAALSIQKFLNKLGESRYAKPTN